MVNFRLHILTGFCLWLLSLQAMLAFPNFEGDHLAVEDRGFSFTQSTSLKLAYQQVDILNLESAPQERPLLQPFRFPQKSSPLLAENRIPDASSEAYTFRDQKYGIKILVFPFHTFW